MPFKKGQSFTEEHRKKLSLAKIGKTSNRKGVLCSEETKNKISLSKTGVPGAKGRHWILSSEKRKKMSNTLPSGKNHWNWKGGVTSENRTIRNGISFRLWREAVFARDNWTCQKYGLRGVKLHPHHIKNFSEFPELRFAIDNGITLSEKAHQEFHKKYGRKNNNKEQIEEYLNKIT